MEFICAKGFGGRAARGISADDRLPRRINGGASGACK